MMPILEPTCFFLAAATVIATLLPMWRYDAWWVRAFEFPRVQIFIVGWLVGGALVFVLTPETGLEKARVGALFACLAFQAWRIFPYTPLAKKQVLDSERPSSDHRLSLLVANVLMDNRQADGLLEHVRRHAPSLVLTVETDAWWEERLREIEDDYPFTVKVPLDNTYGMMLHSRLELIEPQIRYLVEEEVPSIHARVEVPGDQTVQLHFLHPKPPYPRESMATTERDAELLLIGREARRHSLPAVVLPTVVAGDLNDVAWSHTTRLFQRVSGLLDPRIGRGPFSTFHVKIPLLRWPLDHVFHSAHFKLARLLRLAAYGSDHFPIFIELDLEPEAPLEQDAPTPDPQDLFEAHEKIVAGDPLVEVPLDDDRLASQHGP